MKNNLERRMDGWLCNEIDRLKAELAKANQAIEKLDRSECPHCRILEDRMAQAKAENARLDAALKHWQMDARTFEELLAPTIELLEKIRVNNAAWGEHCAHELARLRSLTKKGQS